MLANNLAPLVGIIVACLLLANPNRGQTILAQWSGEGNANDTGPGCIANPPACFNGVATGVVYSSKSVHGRSFNLPANASVDFGDPLRFQGNFSLGFWIRASSGIVMPIFERMSIPDRGWKIEYGSSLTVTHGNWRGGTFQTRAQLPAANRWYHCIVTRTVVNGVVLVDIYINGSRVMGSQTNAPSFTFTSDRLRTPSTTTPTVERWIDEIKLYQGNLNSVQARQAYDEYQGTVLAAGSNTCTTSAGQVLRLTITSLPGIGRTSNARITGGSTGSVAALFYADRPLIPPATFSGCLLHVPVIALDAFPWGPNQSVQFPISIPNDDCLLGQSGFMQALLFEPTQQRITLSNALRAEIGIR